MTPENHRTTLGTPREPYDMLFALRLDETYTPLEAIEVPKDVLAERYGTGRASWTQALARDARVRHISRDEIQKRLSL
jgi:hypothetical protein